jgi:hypothetical protein
MKEDFSVLCYGGYTDVSHNIENKVVKFSCAYSG